MIELLKLLLSLSFSGTVLILILLLSRPLYRNRLSRQWQYYIWLIVVARMLLPFTPEPSLTGSLFQASGSAVMQLRPDGPELLIGRPIPGTDLADENIPSDSSGAESAKSMEPGAAGLKIALQPDAWKLRIWSCGNGWEPWPNGRVSKGRWGFIQTALFPPLF